MRALLPLFEEVLRLPVEVLLRLDFLASVALETAVEIIVLALAADPAPIWEVELIIQRLLLKQLLFLLLYSEALLLWQGALEDLGLWLLGLLSLFPIFEATCSR